MIDIPYEEAVNKIKEDKGLSVAEIESKVDTKLKELNGLISKDGAIHIVANELGVQLVKPQEPGAELKIKDITLESRGIVVAGRVVQKWDIKEFEKNDRKGKVASLLLGDETGVTRLVFWNEQVDVFEELKDGDTLVVKNPFVKQSYKQDRLELQLNTQSELQVNPEGVSVEARPAPESDRPERKQSYIKDLKGDEQNIELVTTVVQVYEPRFYDGCPECRKKLQENLCPNHGEVTPEVNFNMSAFLDDGTGNIRTNFWKKQALTLTGKSEGEFLVYRDNPDGFEEVKQKLLGEIIKVVGSVRKNETFDNLDFNAQLVFTDVDPAKELANLEKKMDTARQESIEKKEELKPKDMDVKEDVISLDDLEEMGK
ncbi:hypothetical protein GOV11_00280 [Candidatus Woesearchaeota archaeon]|nr:hypothetical protein [Candidatus Woesearchaeota archaeon]